jgi:hypothetical protein
MTQTRRDNHSTEFGIWLREQREVDSSLGFVATNLDFIWVNYKTGLWLLLEEKRYKSDMKSYQKQIFELLDCSAKNDKNYRGFYFVQFEKTSPDDGKIWINYKESTKEQLLSLLKFDF